MQEGAEPADLATPVSRGTTGEVGLPIKQLGAESKSAELEAQGEALVGNLGANLDALGPLRDLMMWQKIQGAKGYLLIGMGDAHREGLKDRLNAAGIPHERVDQALVRQRDAINAVWAP